MSHIYREEFLRPLLLLSLVNIRCLSPLLGPKYRFNSCLRTSVLLRYFGIHGHRLEVILGCDQLASRYPRNSFGLKSE